MAAAPQRISTLEAQMEGQSQAIEDLRGLIVGLDLKMDRRLDQVDRRFEGLEQKMDRRFMWVIGMQFTTLLALVASMVTIIGTLLRR